MKGIVMDTRDLRERGREGQEVIHREHRDGRIDVIVKPATIRVKARARVVDVSVSETVTAQAIRAKMTVKGDQHEQG